ncbi:hypothetical protein ACOSQ3_009685 [Xanthoceras sorbifolium]
MRAQPLRACSPAPLRACVLAPLQILSFRIQKQTPFIAFKEEVAKEFGIPVQFQRFWIWAKRQNHTYRPNRPLLPQEEAQT